MTNLVPQAGGTSGHVLSGTANIAASGAVINKTLPAVVTSGRLTNYNASQG